VSALSEPFQVVGYYSQPYNELVHPDRVWRVSKYFLRRWGPYLTPSRFWAVVAARQLAYWNKQCRWFTAYDKRFAGEAQLSTIHFRRLKGEINQPDQAISLFIARKELAEEERYHVVNGQTKPKPTTYTVRLDDPLTPADGLHLAAWLQGQAARRAEEVAGVLRAAREQPRRALLAPLLGPHLAAPPAVFRDLSVLDVVEQVFGKQIARSATVKEEADLLHAYLTGADYYGRDYFRRRWVSKLKPGPAYLLTYLRSLCFQDEARGELRNEVTFTRPELASNLGVTTRTIVNWLGKLETAVPDQALSAFINLVEQKRLPSNDVQYRYRIELLEPLTKADLRTYRKRLQENDLPPTPPHGKNDDHEPILTPAADGKNDSHETDPSGKNDDHDLPSQRGGEVKNDNHDRGHKEKMMTPAGKNDEGSRKKRWPYKYYSTLLQTIKKEENPSLAAADWPSSWKTDDELALPPLAEVISGGELAHFFDLLGVDRAGPVRRRMEGSGLSLTEMAAWYLYAAGQEGLSRPPLHLAIARIQSGLSPPAEYVQLAGLSWELWRCYAALLVLHPAARAEFRAAPLFGVWMEEYGRCRPDDLPFGVGEGVLEFIQTHQAVRVTEPETGDNEQPVDALPAGAHRELWQPVLKELAYAMTKATFNTWLRDSVLLQAQECANGTAKQEWVIGVKNEQAVVWLSQRLNRTVIEPLASAVHGKRTAIRYEVY